MFESWPLTAKAIGGIVVFASTFVEKKRARVADYLLAIAENLDALANAAEQGRKFGSHCIKLRTASRKLHEICQGVTVTEDLKELAEQLNFAATSPGALRQRDYLAAMSGSEKERTIEAFREAAALFEAHALALRAR
ncbi:MAG: hypothetical protein Q8R59_07955 [Polaromonas sp.]|nr:hypothetical protein [Polaromonas sp.]